MHYKYTVAIDTHRQCPLKSINTGIKSHDTHTDVFNCHDYNFLMQSIIMACHDHRIQEIMLNELLKKVGG